VDSDPDSLPLIEYTSGQPRQDGSSSLNGIVVNLDPAPLRIKAWLKQEVEPGEALNYYVQVGNDTGPPQTYALMSFLDYVQIPLNDQKKVEYVSLPPGYRVTVPGKLTAPNERGVHELVILAAYNPYHLLEEPPFGENRERTPVNDWIESSIRVAIIVR
jgi:hypothetical protein